MEQILSTGVRIRVRTSKADRGKTIKIEIYDDHSESEWTLSRHEAVIIAEGILDEYEKSRGW